jgi:kynureninase
MITSPFPFDLSLLQASTDTRSSKHVIMAYSPNTQAYAQMMDDKDGLRSMRDEFFIPEKSSFGKSFGKPPSMITSLISNIQIEHSSIAESDPIIYLAGSAMGLQPRNIMARTQAFLDQWATQAIQAGFTTLLGCPVPSWLEVEQEATRLMAPIVGAKENEVVLMGTLTANLHFMLASFYRPSGSEEKCRAKIMIEEGAFSSDRVSVKKYPIYDIS